MPAIKLKTFEIPLPREPKANDVIVMIAEGSDTKYAETSLYDGSDWKGFSTDVPFSSAPTYSNGILSFSVNYFGVIPIKATYITGWED